MTQRQEAIIRLIVVILATVNQTLTLAGYNPLPFSDEAVYEVFTGIFTVYSILLVWWKNNNMTPEAQKAQLQLEREKRLKEGA